MSRYDGDDYDNDEPFPNASALWANSSKLALKGKRGRKVLAELREALLALPDKRLISSALCTVAPEKRRPQPMRIGDRVSDWDGREFDELVGEQGEGVCAIGAYMWWKKVKAGADPVSAFDDLPTVSSFAGAGLDETAGFAREVGVAYSLAWRLAYKNDETFEDCTPEERYVKFLAWIDAELGDPVSVVSP